MARMDRRPTGSTLGRGNGGNEGVERGAAGPPRCRAPLSQVPWVDGCLPDRLAALVRRGATSLVEVSGCTVARCLATDWLEEPL
jgi:hypothetical protein